MDAFHNTFLHDVVNYGGTEESTGLLGYQTLWNPTTPEAANCKSTFLHDIVNYGGTEESTGLLGYQTLWTRSL